MTGLERSALVYMRASVITLTRLLKLIELSMVFYVKLFLLKIDDLDGSVAKSEA